MEGKSTRKLSIITIQVVLLTIMGCQSVPPQPTSTPTLTITPTATLTPTPLSPTFTPTPISEEGIWKDECSSVSEIGRIGDGKINHIAFSSDGNLTAVSAGAGLALYNNNDQTQLWFVGTKSPIIKAVFMKNDTEILAMDDEYSLLSFDVNIGKIRYQTDPVDVMWAQLSEDGSMVMIADWLSVTYVYDTERFDQISSTEAYITKNKTVTLFISDLVYSDIQFSPNSKLLMTAAFTGRITFFNAKSGTVVAEYPLEERAFPDEIVFSGDSRYLAIKYALEDGTEDIRILSITNGFLKQTFRGENPTLSSDGKLLASQDKNKIMIWEVSSGNLLEEFEFNSHAAGKLRFSSDDTMLFSSTTDGVMVWNMADGTLAIQLPGQFSKYAQVAVSGKENLIAIRSEDYIEVRNIETGQLIVEITAADPVHYMALSKDGTSLAGVFDDRVLIWNPQNGHINDTLNLKTDFVAFTESPSEFILGENYAKISRITIDDGEVISRKDNSALKASLFAASEDGRFIASKDSDRGITLRSSSDWKIIKSVGKSNYFYQAIAVAPSGMVLAAAVDDQTIYFWNTAGDTLCTIKDQPQYITSMTFSIDGSSLFITSNEEGYVHLWGSDSSFPPEWPNQ